MKKLYVVSALAALLATAASAGTEAATAAKPAAEPAKMEAAKPAAEPMKMEAAKPEAKAAPVAAAHKGGKKHHGRHGNTCALADALNGDLKVWHAPTAVELAADEAIDCKKACTKKHAGKKEEMKHDSAAEAKAPAAAMVGDKKPAAADQNEENNEA